MRKVLFTLLLTVLLCGLSGCKTSRATVRTDTEKQIRQTEVTDSSRTEQTTNRDQLNAVLSSSEQQTVVIEFDEWEYYPADDTITAGNYAHNSQGNIRSTEGDADKPPNAGNVKRHKKGTITINGNKQIQQTTEQTSETETNIQQNGSREATLDEATKEKTSTEKKDSSRGYVWIVVGLICAVIFIGIGIYLARRK